MAEALFGTIETQITLNENNLTTYLAGGEHIASYGQEVPQVQTIMQPYNLPIVSVINAPFVEVTSVNGMTGDVQVEFQLEGFQPNHFYKQNTAILHNENLAFALQDFTSGNTFNASDWGYPTFTQDQANWAEDDTTANSYIQNKPTKVSDFTNDQQYQTKSELDTAIATLDTAISGKVDKVTGKGLSTNDYTTSEKNKLTNLANITSVDTPLTLNSGVLGISTLVLLDVFYPVGSYYETSDTSFDPNVSWGGTWVEDTAGRVLIRWHRTA